MSAASSPDDRSRFGVTWLALLVALFLLLGMPTDLGSAPGWQVALTAPATVVLELLGGWIGASNLAFLPVVAALELVALGIAVDLVRGVLARRRGRRLQWGFTGPLGPWKGLLGLSFSAALFASVYLRYLEQPALEGFTAPVEVQERRVELADRLRELRADPREGARIVWIGDSMSIAGLLREKQVEERLSAAGTPYRFARLTIAGMDFFELEPALEEVLALAPDRLVVEINMLFLKFVPTIKRQRSARASRWATKRKNIAALLAQVGIVGPGLREPAGLAAALPMQQPEGMQENGGFEGTMTRWRERRAIPDDPCYVFARRLLERATQAGIRCELIVIPVSDSVGRAAPVFFTDRLALARELADEFELPIRMEAETWPDELFHDGSHMRQEGRERYTETLVELLR